MAAVSVVPIWNLLQYSTGHGKAHQASSFRLQGKWDEDRKETYEAFQGRHC